MVILCAILLILFAFALPFALIVAMFRKWKR